jgi:hypothetical protein
MHRAVLAVAALVTVGSSCRRGETKTEPSPSVTATTSALPFEPAPATKSVERDEVLEPAAADASASAPPDLFDVGPAGPATATPKGVVLISRDDQVVVAALAPGPQPKLAPIELDAGSLSAFGRGAAVAGDTAYWVSKGRLVARKLSGGGLQTLAEDARDGTRVSAALVDGQVVVAYVARPAGVGGDATARLWSGAGETLRLSPEGSAASSVTLLETAAGAWALTLEGRTGMTPVHARGLRRRGGKLSLDEDVVIWIGGSAQPLTEVVASLGPSDELWALVAMERDATRFGLAQVRAGQRPRMGAPVTWRSYPNGLDPAPASSARACGQSFVAYARPSDPKPRAPQELHLARLGPGGLEASTVIARGRAFANVSIASVEGGVLLAYTADHRTWAALTKCPR